MSEPSAFATEESMVGLLEGRVEGTSCSWSQIPLPAKEKIGSRGASVPDLRN